MFRRASALALTSLLFGSSAVAAAAAMAPASPARVVIVDLTAQATSPYLYVSLPASTTVKPPAPGPSESVLKWIEGARLDEIRATLPTLAGKSDLRWISARGDVVRILVIYDASKYQQPEIKVEEETRKSRLESDFQTLIDLIKLIRAGGFVGEDLQSVKMDYTLAQRRSNVTINVTAAAAGDGEPASAKLILVAGPAEHMFLSVDLPLTSIDELKYDQSTGTLEPKDDPAHFLIGFDYMIGDLLSENAPKWWHGFTLKLLLEGSAHPWESGGFAVGYRVRTVKKFGFELDAFSPFAGIVRTKNDVVRSDGSVDVDGDADYAWTAGISFNLDRALGWISGKVGKKKDDDKPSGGD